jgi:hypothetical protein
MCNLPKGLVVTQVDLVGFVCRGPYSSFHKTHIHLGLVSEWSTEFHSAAFYFERRASNQEAHNLARFSLSNSFGRFLWPINQPDDVDIPVIFEF